ELGAGQVVLLIDPARFRPDPAHDARWDDFATELHRLDDTVRRHGRVVVVCGAGPGERGWESEELGATAFAHAVVTALDEREGRTGVVTARELFDDVRKRLAAWSGNNRPTPQTPFLLPLGADGEARADGIRVSPRPNDERPAWDAAPPPSAADLKEWRDLWTARTDRLTRGPHPATYAPRAWRRYEHLLLRHEAALRAGLPAVAGKLADAARAAADDLAAPYGPVFGKGGTFPASFGQALAFDAVRDPAATDPVTDLWVLAKSETAPLPVSGPAGRPSERQLAALVNRFYREVITPPQEPPVAWRAALTLRAQGDRAALGLLPPGAPPVAGRPSPAALSERVRPYIWKTVETADARRRESEDWLFGTDAPKHPGGELEKEYAAAAGTAGDVRFAFLVRDAAFAELPYLGRWAATAGRDSDRLVALWGEVHALDAALARGAAPAELKAGAAAVWASVRELEGAFARAVREETDAALQTALVSKEELLATPLLAPVDRERLLVASRTATYKLLTEPTGTARTAPAGADRPEPRAAARRAWDRVAAAEVGHPGGDAEAAAAESRRRSAAPDDRSARLGVAAAPGADPAQEPAAAAGREAWAALFDALAVRAENDHWYDETARAGPPYFQRVARLFRADAAALRRGAPPAGAPARPLELRPAGDGDRVRWTSEQWRTLGFTFHVPAETPPGRAVLVPRVDASRAPLRLAPGTARRTLLDLRPPPEQVVTVGLEATSEDETPAETTAGACLYFRGQRPDATQAVDVTRRAELVVTDPGPGATAAAVAVRADPTQPLPPVVVLLDYSGSMKEGLNGFRLPGPEDVWKAGPSKFNRLLETLEATLAELPKGTPLRVRLFSAKNLPDWDAVVYPAPGEPAVVDWQGGDTAKLRDLIARLRRYEPSGTTPLIQSVVAAARDDFPARADGPRTLVVLTDGADDSGRPGVPPEERDALKAMLKNTLAATRVKLVVVQFALNDADRTVARDLFADLPALDVPGEVVNAQDADALRRELVAAVWPRLVLGGGAGTRGEYPVGGWPARPPLPPRGDPLLHGTLDPNTLYWSPPLAPTGGTYSARVAGYPDLPPPARGLPAVGLAPGDFLSMSLVRTGDSFLLRRELHADAFGRARKVFGSGDRWVLSVPATGVEDRNARARFGALAFVENVPPHHRRPAAEPEPVVRHVLPGAVWWNVGPPVAAAIVGPPVGWGETKTVVSRLYGYPAPAWDIAVEGWPGSTEADFKELAVTAWVADDVPAPSGRLTVPVPTPGSEHTATAEGRAYRVTVEPVTFAGADRPIPCLVVRAEYAAGDPIQVRLAAPPPGVRTEHRYYRKANGYTAAFGPWPEAAGGAGVSLELFRVAAVTSPPGAAVRLIPPPPALGRRPDDYVPRPSRVGP
ncbi:VWA domain-containing protein, partial [bacterium]|nr:VWA domain-containing protein [bacterium]